MILHSFDLILLIYRVEFIREAIKSQMSESTDYSETGGQEDACAPTSIADLVFFILDDDTIVASKPDGDFLKEIRTASSNRLEHNLEVNNQFVV